MTVTLKKYLPAILVLYAMLMYLALNGSSVTPFSPSIHAHDDFESICRDQVSQEIARRKDAADRNKDTRLAFMTAYAAVLTAGATAISGPAGFYAMAIYGGVSINAIHREYDGAIRALETEEDQRHAQCAADAKYLLEEADAAEQGEEGVQSGTSLQLLGVGFGTQQNTGVTSGGFVN